VIGLIRHPHVEAGRGFTVVELLVAVTIMTTVAGAIFSLMNPGQGMLHAQTEMSDLQQRLRVSADALSKDFMMAGAGITSGAGGGPLVNYFAAVLPFRRGTQSPDPPGTFRSDRVSILYVPSTPSQTTASLAMGNTTADIHLKAQPGCPVADRLCGFKTGMTAVIFDETGAYDTFHITGVVNAPAALQHANQPLSKTYGIGASIAQIVSVTYWLKTDRAANTYQLMRYDSYRSDLPMADNVVGLHIEYFGEPRPPVLRKPVTDPTGPWTSYGPKPPAPGVDNPADGWPAGENCLFAVDPLSGQPTPRPDMVILAATSGLVKLDPASLTDGPWCPDSASPARVDADLLRVRKIRVALRLQVGSEALRGTGALFAHAGTSRGGERFVPDQEVRFDVTPRNLNLGR